MAATKSAFRILIASFVLLALVGMPAAAADTTELTPSEELSDAPMDQIEQEYADEKCYDIVDPETGEKVGEICIEVE